MPIKTIFCAACLAALSAKATAHHEAVPERQYLAFWSGYRLAFDPRPTLENCREGRFWEKGFVSIYAQGAE